MRMRAIPEVVWLLPSKDVLPDKDRGTAYTVHRKGATVGSRERLRQWLKDPSLRVAVERYTLESRTERSGFPAEGQL